MITKTIIQEELSMATQQVNAAKLKKAGNELTLIEVKCSIGAREDLGRPTTTALENKNAFIDYLRSI